MLILDRPQASNLLSGMRARGSAGGNLCEVPEVYLPTSSMAPRYRKLSTSEHHLSTNLYCQDARAPTRAVHEPGPNLKH
eukprot:37934-Rhodomonas_salina.2